MPRQELISLYQSADVLLLHLNHHEAFKKVIPSKIFEYAATGKPILAGVSGTAAQFLRDNVEGAMVFEPCDYKTAAKMLKNTPLHIYDRSTFVHDYARDVIMTEMAARIVEIAKVG